MTSTRTSTVCGVDIGSTNTKVVLLDQQGGVVAVERRPTPRDPRTNDVLPRELLTAVEQLMLTAAGTRWQVAAVASAGVGEDGVLIDHEGAALTPAISWFDPRRDTVLARSEFPTADRRTTG